jgi:DNA-binding XRE family transcriptional regulator
MADISSVAPPDPGSGDRTAPSTKLDDAAMKAFFGPNGEWPKRCGALVRERRTELGVTPLELANRCHLGRPTICKIELGITVPSLAARAAIAYHLDTDTELLWPYPSNGELERLSSKRTRR